MGVRPPADDDDDGPDVVEFGIAALDAKIGDADVEFPIESQSLANRAGHLEIPYDTTGHTITLEEALAETSVHRFEHEQELLNALHPVFESKREAAGNGVLAQLRALVPF